MKKRLSVLLKSEVVLAALYLDPRYNYYFIFAVLFLTTPHPPILFKYNVILEEDQLKAAQKQLMKLWRLIESNKNDPPANTPSLLQPVQPNENKVGLTNDELQEILFIKEAERREKNNENANEAVIEKMIHDFMKPKLIVRSTDVLKYWEDNRLLQHQLYVLAKVVLAVPCTQMSVERLFSGLKFILSVYRSNLTESILEDILVVRANALFMA
ncbi:uncharacterized protein LOC116928109 [Daphnia magna]|uniref:uncharacterized protein LOC116928109 n=1 Tax=Daphnia magna TaxID=35525 RepID=UPI001E1BD934|nr:uncharacterized protein LOC116928109 [Daphnia magna]